MDVYSFTQDKPWINHEWLSEAAMAAAYGVGGARGLILLKIVLVGAVLLMLAWRLKGATPLMTALCLAFTMFCVLPISLTVRPQLWSALGLSILVVLVDCPRPSPRTMLAVAALFTAWANFHGGWITGAAVLGVYAIVRAVRRRADAPGWLVLAIVGCAATLVNPYGFGLWRFLAETVAPARPDILEWQPLSLALPWTHWVPVAAPVVVAIALSAGERQHRPTPEMWAVIGLLSASAIRVMRVGPLVAPAEILLLAPRIRDRWGRIGRVVVPNLATARLMWIPVLVAVMAVYRPTVAALQCIRIEGVGSPDRQAAALLTGATGRLWVAFNWGEYAIWHFGPNLKVSTDGRRETIYSEAVLQLHRDFERGDPRAATSVVSSFSPDFVWLPSSDLAARNWLAVNGYRIDADTGSSFVARRNGSAPLRIDAPSLSACFP